MKGDTENLILITADSVRADYCFTEFGGHPTTPELDRLIEDGVHFTNASSPGARTLSSVPEIISGEFMPYRDIEGRYNQFNLIEHVISKHETLPEKLCKRGYSTAAVTASPYTTRETGFDTIFDRFIDVGDYEKSALCDFVPGKSPSRIIERLDQYRQNKHWFNQWPNFYDDILATIDGLKEPYFLWIFLLDTHNPYLPPKEDRIEANTFDTYYSLWMSNQTHSDSSSESAIKEDISDGLQYKLQAAYRDTIRSVDRFVGQIVEDTSETDPVLIFTADHGEAFGEHGTYGHHPVVYEENIHVPFVVLNAKDRGEKEHPISLRDLGDILVEYVDSGTLFTDKRWSSEYTISRAKDGTVAIRGKKWKYISTSNDEELYNLNSDSRETQDVSKHREDVASMMRRRKEEFYERLDKKEHFDLERDIGSDIVDRLESLGYVGE